MNGDFPRWGDYPEKLNLTYIADLVARGAYFDDRLLDVIARDVNDFADARNFAPNSAKNDAKFEYLVKNRRGESGGGGGGGVNGVGEDERDTVPLMFPDRGAD